MKKIYSLVVCIAVVFSLLNIQASLKASPVDSKTARVAATNFYNWKTGRSVSPEQAQLTYVEQLPSQGSGKHTSSVNAFYVFGVPNCSD